MIKEKIGIECKVINCWNSGTVIIVKLQSEKREREIMRNKHRLKGDMIFIENDLSWKKRRIQERINRWVKDRKRKV